MPQKELPRRSRSQSIPSRMSYTLPPHPSDPLSLFNSQPVSSPGGASNQSQSTAKHKIEVQGEELWVYSGAAGYVWNSPQIS
jgi:hypothetical protein